MSVFLYNGKSARLRSKLRSPRASVGDCSPNFISCRVGKSMWELVECESRYSPRIQRQFRLAHLRDATNEKGDESSSTFFPPPLPYCLVAISQETRETLTERVLLEKFVAKRLFCHSYHLIRITLIYSEFYFYVLFKSLHMCK